VLLRRAPRYVTFGATGAAAGGLVALGLALVGVQGRGFTTVVVPLDLTLVGALVGALLGVGSALAVERR
jgi:hypothetical protein